MRGTAVTLRPWQQTGRHLSTGVPCPRCHESALAVRFSCLTTRFSCGACHRVFDLTELHRLVGNEELQVLATLVQDQLSDRV